MDADLRGHFDRAVGDDPGADPGELARAAIAGGGLIRRRRTQVAAVGLATGLSVLGVVAGVSAWPGPAEPREQEVTVAAAMGPVSAPSCSEKPVERDATDAMVFLDTAATDAQRTALREALGGDARVAALAHETREEAFERFRERWADSPDFVDAVSPDSIPEAFRLRLSEPGQFAALSADYTAMPGVRVVQGRICPASAPIGGTL